MQASGSHIYAQCGRRKRFAEEVFVADEGRRGVELGGGLEVDRVVVGVGVEADEDGVDVA